MVSMRSFHSSLFLKDFHRRRTLSGQLSSSSRNMSAFIDAPERMSASIIASAVLELGTLIHPRIPISLIAVTSLLTTCRFKRYRHQFILNVWSQERRRKRYYLVAGTHVA